MHVNTELDEIKKMLPEEQQDFVKRNIKVTPTIITPLLANEILLETEKAGFINRQISPAQVNKLAGVMSREQWNPCTGETIAVTTEIHNGKKLRVLLNGQHRFHAVVKSSVTIVVLVVSGVSRESFKEMDQGKARDIKAMAQIDGWKRPAQTTGAAELYYVWDQKGSPLVKLSGLTKPEIYQLLVDVGVREELEATVDQYWDVVESSKQKLLQAKITLILIMLWNRTHPDVVEDICKYFMDPEHKVMPHSPVFEFTFNRIEKQHDLDRALLGTGMSRGKQMEYLLKMLCLAWAVHVDSIHPCATQEDYEEMVEAYMYGVNVFHKDDNKDGYPIHTWNEIFSTTYQR